MPCTFSTVTAGRVLSRNGKPGSFLTGGVCEVGGRDPATGFFLTRASPARLPRKLLRNVREGEPASLADTPRMTMKPLTVGHVSNVPACAGTLKTCPTEERRNFAMSRRIVATFALLCVP